VGHQPGYQAPGKCDDQQAAEKLFSDGVILSVAGVPGDGRFCRCWGGGAKDLLFARAEDKADPSVAQNGATSG